MAILKADLNTCGLISNRTLLHYAAKEGHAETVRELLRAGFTDVNAEDGFGHTALHLAVAELHLDVVEVLMREGGACAAAGESCLSAVGDFVRFRPYAADADRINDEIKRTVPSIVALLLEKEDSRGAIADESEDHFALPCIVSSPEAVRILCKAGFKPSFAEVSWAFDTFRHRVQALSAVETLFVMAREFGVDINAPLPLIGDDSVLVVLTRRAIAEAVIMAIDHLGADTATPSSVTDHRGRTIRQIAQERAAQRDQEGVRLLAYFDSIGLLL
jgi:hypothetical protein